MGVFIRNIRTNFYDMNKSVASWASVAFVISIFIYNLPVSTYGQSQSTIGPSKITSDNGSNVVSVSASVTVQVSNDSLKAKDAMLRSSVVGFLNSGPNVLKTTETTQPIIKSKIANQINNDTQIMQGIEATNAIIGVEISKALKSVVSSSDKPNGSAIVTIQTSSTCKPTSVKSISCDNTVTIK